jgi:hypothetical protein
MKDLLKKYPTFSKIRFFSKEWFAALLQGERPLWEAWFVLGVAIVVLVALLTFLELLYPNLNILFSYILLFVQIFYWVAVWRCAKNASTIYLYLSRGLVLMGIFSLLGQFLRLVQS